MENASKALIIAGAILISIIIISLAVAVFYKLSHKVEDHADFTQEEIASFNSKITPYIGKNISGSQVNALINLGRAINSRNDDMKSVTITYGGSTLSKTVTTLTRVTTGKFYRVDGTYDQNGLITTITISDT